MNSARERQLELGTEMLLLRVNEMKSSLNNLILKVEMDHQNFSFPDALDSFAVISSQMNTIMKLLKSDRLPSLKELVAIPLLLNQDKDSELEKMTEGRLSVFDHSVVPDYLRTKPDPTVEKEHEKVEIRGAQMNPDTAAKQATNLNKMANHLLEIISANLNEWEASSERSIPPQTSSVADTQELATSVFNGKAFRIAPVNLPMRQPPQTSSAPTGPASSSAQPTPQQAKSGTIKTTIKAAGRNY